MHEVALMNNLLSIVNRAASGALEPVKVVHMRIGSMAGVNKEALQFAFEVLSPGSAAAGAKLEVETVPLGVRCRACEEKWQPREPIFICEKCGSTDVEILSGREMEIDYILVGETTPGDSEIDAGESECTK